MSRRTNNLKRMKEAKKRRRLLREFLAQAEAGIPGCGKEQRNDAPGSKRTKTGLREVSRTVYDVGGTDETEIITCANDDERLVESNYWDSEPARRGLFYVSINAGAFRLLVPQSEEHLVCEIRTGRHAVITSGFHRLELRNMYEIMFEDDTDTPFALWLCHGQFERVFSIADAAGEDRHMIIYTRYCVEVARMPVFFRKTETLPCLKPWPHGQIIK